MSITFESDAKTNNYFTVQEPCLCAQMADAFGRAMEGDLSPSVRDNLAIYASSGCHICGGTGVESVTKDNLPTLNLANENAKCLLASLGFTANHGCVAIPALRQALMRAKNRSDLSEFTRSAVIDVRAAKLESGARYYDFGCSAEQLREYLNKLSDLVEAAAAMGAKWINWS